ncbi:MAG: beta-ketoacyl-ACP synthase III [Methyloceanibacter sp.]|nr:beta-ketoacyl-ACP synthase III [Methyloceanibacter sp.]
MSNLRSVVKGVGGYLPDRIVTNEDLTATMDTSDEWIVARTGIRERRIVADGELTSSMAIEAAKRALEDAQVDATDIDLIVLATSTPDQTFPATAVTVQAELGITDGAAFDMQAVCSGFVFALATADNYLLSGQFKRALVIGSEAFSRILDWEDRSTCVLFGDGAGALVVEAQKPNGALVERGVLATTLRSDGRYRDKLYVDGGPSSTGTVGYLRMDGPEVFRHAVTKISDVILETLEKAGYTPADIDWFVPHQANKRILDGAARRLGLERERLVMTVDKHANTSAASIPLALMTACTDGRIKEGDLVLLEAMGGGFTWGSLLIRW